MKSLENLTTDELFEKVKQLHAATNFSPVRLANNGENLLLEKKNPADRSWYENDAAYEII